MPRACDQFHRCPKCEAVYRGPSFYQHVSACKGQLDVEDYLKRGVVHHYTISNNTLYRSNGEAVKQL